MLEYFDKFKEEDIDMDTVLKMNESDLKELCLECGIKSFGKRFLFIERIRRLKTTKKSNDQEQSNVEDEESNDNVVQDREEETEVPFNEEDTTKEYNDQEQSNVEDEESNDNAVQENEVENEVTSNEEQGYSMTREKHNFTTWKLMNLAKYWNRMKIQMMATKQKLKKKTKKMI